MKVLITGGTGFVGYYLCKKLVADGDDVFTYDSFTNFVDPMKSTYEKYLKIRLNDLKGNVNMITGDVRHNMTFFKTLNDIRPDCVVHLAALPISTVSNRMPEEAIGINLDGTINVLESIRQVDSVKKFVYTSSSMVYGNFGKDSVTEDTSCNPLDVYGATKLSGEILTRTYGTQYGINHVIIRPSAVYGPTDANRRVSQIFVENALTGKPLTMHGDGSSKLDFTYVDDLAEGFRLAVKSDKADNQTFNMTRGESRSLKEFIDILRTIVPDLSIETKDPDMKRPERGTLDITKAKELLGYAPKYSLEEGVKLYVEFVRNQLKSN